MSMKVDNSTSASRIAAVITTPASRGPSSANADKPVAAVQPVDNLRLTGQAMDIKAMARSLASAPPPLDIAKVNALRDAIAQGSYTADAHRIANSLLAIGK